MFTQDGLLRFLFREAEKAGFGFADGPRFEAIPGLEDAAADFIEDLLVRLGGDQ